MAAESCPSDSHTTTAHNTVFIDTNLDTHLALMVSSSDTVFDLKKKIMYEHPRCFPNTGEIKIHALKVKRKEYFYHLSDYMFVKSAFEGVKNNWFLSADASSLVEHSENFHSRNHDSTNVIACIGIKNNPSADGVDLLLPAGPPKRSSNFNDSSLPQIGASPNMNQEVPVADRFGSGGSDTEVSKDLMMEVNLISKDHFKSSPPDASKRSDLDREVSKDLEMEVIHESDDHFKASSSDANKRSDTERQARSYPYSNDYEVQGIRTEGDEDNSMNRISDVQRNVALEGAVKSGPAAKEKGKAKRKLEDAVDDHTLEESNALVHGSGKDTSQQGILVLENSLGDAGGQSLCDMEMGNENIAYEPYRSLPSDTGKRSDHGVEKLNDPGKHIECENNNFENGVVDVQYKNSLGEATQAKSNNNSIGEASQAKPARKKLKIEKKNSNEDSSEKNKSLSCDPSKEPSKPEIPFPESASGDKEKSRIDTLDDLSENPLGDFHSVRIRSSSEEKRRKTKFSDSHNQVVAVIPSSVKDVREEISAATVGTNHKDLDKENEAAIVPGQSVQGATVSKPCVVSSEDKHCDPIQEEEKRNKLPFSLDIHKVVGRSDGSELPAAVGVRKKKSSKKGSVIETKDQPPVVAKEPSHLDEKGTHITEVVMTSNLVDANGTLEPGSEKKTKKSRKTKSSVGATQAKAGTEVASARGSVIDTKDQPPVVAANEQSHLDGNDMNITEVVVTSNVLDANGILEHDPEKKRKKSRKTKSLVGATQVTAGTEHASGSGSVINTKDQPPVVFEGPSHLDEKNTNISEVVVTSNLLDANGTLEPDSEKMRKKSIKTKGSVGAKQVTSGTENASASGSVIDTKDKPPVVVNEQSHQDEKDANIAEVVVASNLLDANGTLEPDSEKKRKMSRKSKGSVGAVNEQSHLDEKMAEVVVASNLLDANGTLAPDSEKKRKKSRKTISSVGATQVTAGAEGASASGSVTDTKDRPPVVVKEPSHLDEKDTNIAEVVVTSNLFNANGIMEPDSERKKKKSRKTKSSVGATQVTAGAEGASASGSVTDTKDQPPVVVKEPSHLDEQDTNIAEVVVTSNLFDANGIMETDSERKKKKSRKTKSSVGATKVTPGSEVASGSGIFTERQKAVNDYHSSDKAEIEGSVLPQREGKEVSKIVTVNADRKTDEVGKNEVESLLISKTQEKTENADAKKIRNAAAKSLPNMHMREQDGGGKDPEQSTDSTREVDASSKVTKKKTKSAKKDSMDRLNGSNMEPEKDIEGESNQINFNDYFVPPQHQHEVNASGTRAMLEKSNSTFSAPSSSLDSSKHVIHQEKRGNEHQSQVVNHPVPVRKVSDANKEGSENKKSLLATSGMIFKDDASESSDDKDEVYSSDASTRSPLDNSSSSDYSDVESNANFNSQQNGLHTSNRNESGGKGIIEPHSSGLKNLTLDTILRSSSRYKKAKLTASQLETESQPIDFVPDSQANQ